MTTQQKAIIDALTTEFTRINESNKTKKSFNLINADALQEQTIANRCYAELSRQDLASWNEAAYAEMWRIMELLVEDLPEWVRVEIYDEHIGKYKSPSIQLRHWSVGAKAHREWVLAIHVHVEKCAKHNEHHYYQDFGKRLYYTHSASPYGVAFDTIEDLVNDNNFKNALRTRVIR